MLNAWYGLLIETLNMFKVDKSDEDAMRVHESWRSNESEIVYSHQPTLINQLSSTLLLVWSRLKCQCYFARTPCVSRLVSLIMQDQSPCGTYHIGRLGTEWQPSHSDNHFRFARDEVRGDLSHVEGSCR